MTTKPRVAIVGGGMGGLAAAFELEASRPGEYDITIYERDWRLGGKGASGRNVDEGLGQRIEEHGLHVLMGFYDNVFEVLNRCYSDLRATGQLPPAGGPEWWNGVLHGMDELYFAEPPRPNDPDRWLFWRVPFTTNQQTIGGPAQPLPSIADLALAALQQFVARLGERHFIMSDDSRRELEIDSIAKLKGYAETEASRAHFASLIQSVLGDARQTVDLASEANHKWFVALYIAGTNLIGLISDVLWDEDNFRDRLDTLDYKDWIKSYNCLDLTADYLWESAPVNAVYDLVFSRNRGFSAGSALYDTMLMLFHYRGHVFYKMAGGMGDIVFMPLYLWLSNRNNVQFKFFHELTDIELSDDQKRVAKLSFHVPRQRQTGNDNDSMVHIQCLDDHGKPVTLPCWPSTATGRLTTGPGDIVVTDFDLVVLAVPVGALTKPANGRPVCENLYVDPDFRKMATGMVTRGTRAVQLWFSTDLAGLGWPPSGEQFPPPIDAAHGPVLGSYDPAHKFNSWSDMTQVLPREPWGAGGPRNIAYLCDVDDGPDDAQALSRVYADAVAWLTQNATGLWPKFSWDLLVDSRNAQGRERFIKQYWRANTDPAQHYVLGAPGTTALRLDPHGTRFSNLYLAGDWVKTPLNAGCVEGAAMGGRTAAQRILENHPAAGPTQPVAPPVPRYIVRDGDLPLLPAVVMGDVTLHGYVLTTSTDLLKDLLARSFAGTGVTCTPLLPIVLVTSVRAEKIRSGARPDDGYLTEAEFGFWIPVHLRWQGGAAIALYLPYLFVDNPAALLAGREIYGFNKILGQFRYASPSDIDPAEVTAQVLHTLAPDSRLDWLTVAAWTGTTARTQPIWDSAEAALAGIAARLVSQFTATGLRADFSLPALPLVFLKQFRDAADGANACHQAVVLARATLAPGVSGGWLDCDGLQLALTGHATLDVARTLGLAATESPRFGFWVKFTATVQPGQELPKAGHAD